jgi:hypothetical protein
VPQPLQLHAPPEIGCGPRATCLPALTTAESVFVQLPSMEMYGVMAVGVQVCANAGRPALAATASVKVDNCDLIFLPFSEGLGRLSPPVTSVIRSWPWGAFSGDSVAVRRRLDDVMYRYIYYVNSGCE